MGSSEDSVQPKKPCKIFSVINRRSKAVPDCISTGCDSNVTYDIMTKFTQKQEVKGTRTGYVIRFTCPSCLNDNAIVNKTPKECYRESRDATCHQCKKRSTVITPGMYEKKLFSPV